MATNDFLEFANIGGANVISQAEFAALASRPTGFAAGIARSVELNKVWRQSALMSAAVAQFIVDSTDKDVLDNGDMVQLSELLLQAIQARTRIKLTADLTLYVNASTGSDTNSGLSAGQAFQSMQKAWDTLFNVYDFNGFSAVVQCASGTYNQQTTCVGTPVGVGPNSQIIFRGNLTTPSVCVVNITLAMCFSVVSVAVPVVIEGFRLIASGTAVPYQLRGVAINATQSTVIINKLEFGACGTQHMNSSNGAAIFTSAQPYAIVGSCPVHVNAYAGGLVIAANSIITLTGTPTFSTGFAQATSCGIIEYYGMTFSGGAVGPRYVVATNGVINVAGSGASYLPGDSAGSAASGGQYN